jgi:hypothetical protein
MNEDEMLEILDEDLEYDDGSIDYDLEYTTQE